MSVMRYDFRDRLLLWDAFESRLRKMFVERKRLFDAMLLHDHEGHAVGQRIALVSMAAEIEPRLCKQRFVDMHNANQWAVEQRFADGKGFGVMPLAVKKGRHLIKNVGRRNEGHARLADVAPGFDGGAMMLIVRRLQRNQEPRVEKISRHGLPYKWVS